VLNLKKVLKNRLCDARRVAILGIGSDLRADDASGMIAAESLRAKLLKNRKKSIPVKIFFGETAPENLTGDIKKFMPSHILIIDTLDGGKRAGSIYLFKPEEVSEGTSFSTHKMPAKILVDYLNASCRSQTTIIGIQPKTVDFGKPVTAAVFRSAHMVAEMIFEAIR
jgi:hydrogenase 3 maturation protease